jgi:SAM-dependent methyltransferase
MSFVKKKYYQDESDYEKYLESQKSAGKWNKERNEIEYHNVSCRIKNYIKDGSGNMLCMGARNNHEKNCFSRALPNYNISDMDLYPNSGCDYIMDFNELPNDWSNKWDIIYTNAPDHAFDGEKAYNEWLRVLKTGGILIVGWSIINMDKNHSENAINGIDSCLYGSLSEIDNWLTQHKGIQIIDRFGYLTNNGIVSEEKTFPRMVNGIQKPDGIKGYNRYQYNYFMVEKI